MKLARIQHLRCGSPENSTHVWIPDDMTEAQLDFLVEQARKDLLDAERQVAGETAPPYRTYWDWLSKCDKNKTVNEVEAEYAQHAATYKAWESRRDAARKSFAQRLKELSGERKVLTFYEMESSVETECDWGHNHGTHVDYGNTEIE